MKFSGKTVVITGGTAETGLGLARHLLKQNVDKVALLDLYYPEELITILREEFPKQQILFHLTDVTVKDDLDRAFREVMFKFKSIDCVITCAGILDESNYETMVETNLLGTIHTNYTAIRYMSVESGGNGGLLVNIASIAGIDCSQFGTPVYNATKHAVVAFSRSLGTQFYYDRHGLKCLTVCPGLFYTQYLDDQSDNFYSDEAYELNKHNLKDVQRQTADEFAIAAVEVIAQEKNGSVWMIDGGRIKEIEKQNHWTK